ncbi:MAG: hypothetical protein QCI38_07075 [Candidatus Thermoplasmatota archaeon]|nr:hypothetical protein [Candidatus Thermoplasmatota archaeon]
MMRPNMAVVSAFVLGALLIASSTVPSVFSQGVPYYVFGYVLDENGDPVENASMEAFLGQTILGNATSDQNGLYMLFVDTSAITSGSEFFVRATSMGKTNTSSTSIVPSAPGHWLNMTLGTEVSPPQCYSCDSQPSIWMLATAAGSIVVVLLLLFFIKPKKNKKQEEGGEGSHTLPGSDGEKEEQGGG